MPILSHPVAGPDRDRPEAMDHALETSTERLRDHLRRPNPGQREQLTEDATYTVNLTDPAKGWCGLSSMVSAAIAAGSEPETRPDDRGARASRFYLVGLDRLHRNDRSDVRPPVAALRPTPGEGIWDTE